MAFKIKPPFKIDNTPIYNYPMDEEGVLGKANRNGTILINQDLSPDKAKEVEEHEMGHIEQMKRGDLDYDDENVYWKGKTYPRSKMKEGAHDLPWEKEIYDKTEKKEKMAFKLDGNRKKSSPFANLVDKGLISPLKAEEGGEEKIVAGNKKKGMLDKFEVVASRPQRMGSNVNIGRNYMGKYVREGDDAGPIADYNQAFQNWTATAKGYGGFNDRIAGLKSSGKTEDARQAQAAIRLAKQDFNKTDQGRALSQAVMASSIAPDAGGNRKTISVREDMLSKYGFED